MIHTGVSRNANKIAIEKCSFNAEYISTDVQDKCPENNCCIESGLDSLETKLDVENLCQIANGFMKTQGLKIECEPSTDPGK